MAGCAGLEIIPAGGPFRRPGGREGHWLLDTPHRKPDDLVTCPFDFVKVSGQQAEAALDEIKRHRPDMTPILFGSPHEAGLLLERMAIWPAGADEWLAAAQTSDVDRWLAERQAELDACCEQSGETIPRRGPWPETVRSFTRLRVPDEILKAGRSPSSSLVCCRPPTQLRRRLIYTSAAGMNARYHRCISHWHDVGASAMARCMSVAHELSGLARISHSTIRWRPAG